MQCTYIIIWVRAYAYALPTCIIRHTRRSGFLPRLGLRTYNAIIFHSRCLIGNHSRISEKRPSAKYSKHKIIKRLILHFDAVKITFIIKTFVLHFVHIRTKSSFVFIILSRTGDLRLDDEILCFFAYYV